ncbi:MAG: hypothetical protein NZM35_11180 [Chitinophagales bacterium]|nr:hypothetical protein [Chitinophagales bacterium]MDW8419902.1 hypothetical protein [Chitinophagales bacterium]
MTVTYKTEGQWVNNAWLMALTLTVVPFGLMALLMYAGLPAWVSIIAFLVIFMLLYVFFSGEATYTLDESGLKRTVTPYLSKKLSFIKSIQEQYAWSQVRSFTNDTDYGRTLREFEYLTITFQDGKKWRIRHENDEEGFDAFRNEFLRIINAANESYVRSMLQTQSASQVNFGERKTPELKTASVSGPPVFIRKQKSLYQTVWAKALLIVMMLLTAVVLAVMIAEPQKVKWHHTLRIGLIVIPGILYLWYRITRKDQ